MKGFLHTLTVIVAAAIIGAVSLQTQAGGGGFGGGGFGGRGGGFGGRAAGAGGFGNAGGRGATSIRQSVLARTQQAVGFSNDEWSVIEPKLWRVVSLKLAIGEGPAITAGGRFARGGNTLAALAQAEEDATTAQLSKQLEQLRQQLETFADDQGTNNTQYKNTMTQFRDTHAKIEEALADAERDLQSVLTLRQESLLLAGDYMN